MPGVIANRLDLYHAALRELSLSWLAILNLLGGVQAKVGVASALLGQFGNAEHLGLQAAAHRI